ncbi:hypothetical protein DB346_07505 [Verrucomicrobia bacterium LW23]|nr:hypothetical protein DB346_07505 [Verrucomicrobia bacterium LW23]
MKKSSHSLRLLLHNVRRSLKPAAGARVLCANDVAEGMHYGAITRLSDAAIAARHSLVKVGSDAAHVAVTGVSDIPLGICLDEPAAAEEPVAVALLGAAAGTLRAVASGTVTAGDYVVPAASGAVRTLPVAAGTYYIVGRAIATAASGALVEMDPCVPVQRVVS